MQQRHLPCPGISRNRRTLAPGGHQLFHEFRSRFARRSREMNQLDIEHLFRACRKLRPIKICNTMHHAMRRQHGEAVGLHSHKRHHDVVGSRTLDTLLATIVP